MISGAVQIAGVVGYPVWHSLSPLLHRAWLDAAGIDGLYGAFAPPNVAAFDTLLEALHLSGVVGVNVTAPYKLAALQWVERSGGQVSETARKAGGANLVRFGETLSADSFDGQGVLTALAEQAPRLELRQTKAVILGAGGAAQAAAAALVEAGVGQLTVINRNLARAERLVADIDHKGVAQPVIATLSELAETQLLINATSAGDVPDLSPLPKKAVVMDMTYRPLLTPLLSAAQGHGLGVVDGLAMLIGQAIPSFAALYGRSPPELDVRGLALAQLETERCS